MPAFVGDKSYIEFLLNEKVPLRVARDFCLTGCIDASLTGQSRIIAYPMFIVPLVLELTLNNGVHPRTGERLGPPSGDRKLPVIRRAMRRLTTADHFCGLRPIQ
jgi:formate C-acetyltransferase